jgi:predicted dienelactone hydrolase
LSVFIERPADIKRLIDFMLAASAAAANIDPARIGFFGFSRGGYTGLVLIGANPDWSNAIARCEGASAVICQQLRNKEYTAQTLAHDARIKVAVIADPLSVFFTAGSFAAVQSAVQLWGSETGGDGVEPHSVAAINRELPAQHEYRVVPNSVHFAFLTPCPPDIAKRRPELCTDPPGFDRVAFHSQFNADLLTFFRANLGAARQ